MELVEVKCTNCTKEIYIYKDHVRKNIFCTLGCMNSYEAPSSKKSIGSSTIYPGPAAPEGEAYDVGQGKALGEGREDFEQAFIPSKRFKLRQALTDIGRR